MKLFLAPMEGVVDFVLRDLLTNIGGIDQCVTEFMRVTDKLMPDHIFFKYSPELKMNSRTRAGTPIFFQLLGGQPQPLAENALRAVELGAIGIDLNFGCPAKTVNRHDGGATLLKNPCRVYDIVKAVRSAVPIEIPVTAKIRLGFDDASVCIENAKAAAEAGAFFLTVHARTKTDGYRPPAHWDWIPKIREQIQIPVIANGEVWNVDDYDRCREVTGCEDVMIGRGAIANPYLFREIKASLMCGTYLSSWNEIQNLLPGFFKASEEYRSPDFALARTKQWLKALTLKHEPAREIFDQLKVITKPYEFKDQLQKLSANFSV